MTQNGIEFTIQEDPVFIYGVNKVTNSNNVDQNGKYYVSKINSRNQSKPAVNAIDIDWNSAAFKSAVNALTVSNEGSAPTSITTTGELLALLAQQQKQIDTLIIMMKGLYQGLFTD